MNPHHITAPNPQLRVRVKIGLIQSLYSQGLLSRAQRDTLLQLQRTEGQI